MPGFRRLAEGNATGIVDVQAEPAVYDLLSLSEAQAIRRTIRQSALSTGFSLGVDWVRTHPREYALYDTEERARLLAISETEGRIEGNLTGETYVLTHPDEFDWVSHPVKGNGNATPVKRALPRDLRKESIGCLRNRLPILYAPHPKDLIILPGVIPQDTPKEIPVGSLMSMRTV